jgi:hypothetical protein
MLELATGDVGTGIQYGAMMDDARQIFWNERHAETLFDFTARQGPHQGQRPAPLSGPA